MASITEALRILYRLEFNSDKNVLHVNKHENGFTFYGIYQSAHPKWEGWSTINACYNANGRDVEATSVILAKSLYLRSLVNEFYKKEFWDKARLDEVNSQQIANEVFVFGVNVGMKIALMKAQRLVGADVDGIIGNQTLRAINEYDERKFDIAFDEVEIKYYEDIIKSKPYLSGNYRGWVNRANYV